MNPKSKVKDPSINSCQVSSVLRQDSANTRCATAPGLKVQSPFEVNFLLNLFYTLSQINTKIPHLPMQGSSAGCIYVGSSDPDRVL